MPISATALEPLLRLALVPGVGPARLSALVRHFGSAERVLNARPGELRQIGGVGGELVGRIQAASGAVGHRRARVALAAMEAVGAVAFTPDDLAYPEAFRALTDPPYLLFAAGNLDFLHGPGFAIVGTRRPTPAGRKTAATLSDALAREGYVIVSGMARGIDASAHEAALDANAGSVGVLGNGIDRVYPAENRWLFDRMRQAGLLVSEFPPGEKPLAGNFPRRNRLVAALSRGVLVVEMGLKSGAQHTVRFALEQGRDVFAVPGPIGSPVSEGTNQLLKDGARLVTSVDDILEELEGIGRVGRLPDHRHNHSRPSSLPSEPAGVEAASIPVDLPPDEAVILGLVGTEPRHVDDLAAESGRATGELLGLLLGLELHGLVESLPGKRFRRR